MNSVIELNCEYTKPILKEMKKPLLKKTNKITLFFALGGIALLLAGLIFKVGSLIYFGLFWTVFFLIRINHPARKSARQAVKSNQKNYGETVKTTLKFYRTMFTAVNHQSGSEKKIRYEDVQRLIRTKNLIILIAEDSLALMGDCRTAEPEQVKELWKTLVEQCINAEKLIREK